MGYNSLKNGMSSTFCGGIIEFPVDKNAMQLKVFSFCVKKFVSKIKSCCTTELRVSVILEFFEFKEFVK